MPVCQNCKNDLSRASFSKTQLRKEPEFRKCKACILSASVTTSEVPTACVPVPGPEVAVVEPVVSDKVAPAAPESSNMYSDRFHCIVCNQDLDKKKFSKNQLKKHAGALRCKSCVKNVENQEGAEADVPSADVKETATSKPVEVEVAPKEVQVTAPSQVVNVPVVDVPVVDVPSDEDMDEKKANKEEPVTEDPVAEDDVEDKEKEVDDAPSDEDTKPVVAVKTEAIDIPAETEEIQTNTNESDQMKVAKEPNLSSPPPPVTVAVVSPEKATVSPEKATISPEKATPEPTKPASPSPTPAAPSAPKTATPSPNKIPSPASVPVKTASQPAPIAKPKSSPSPPVTQSLPKPAPLQTTIPPSKKQSNVELNEPVSPNIADIETDAMEKATCCIIS